MKRSSDPLQELMSYVESLNDKDQLRRQSRLRSLACKHAQRRGDDETKKAARGMRRRKSEESRAKRIEDLIAAKKAERIKMALSLSFASLLVITALVLMAMRSGII